MRNEFTNDIPAGDINVNNMETFISFPIKSSLLHKNPEALVEKMTLTFGLATLTLHVLYS